MTIVRAYYRADRKVYGVRNHVLILPTTICTNRLAELIYEEFKGESWGEQGENRVVLARHNAGCCHVGFDLDVAFRTLLGIASNPNVYGVILVSLGCGQLCKKPLGINECKHENLMSFKLYDRLVKRGVKVRWVNVQEQTFMENGFERSTELGRKFVKKMVEEASSAYRVETPIKRILVGVGNGASDPTSGLFANPVTGYLVEKLVSEGASVVFAQTTEVLGSESLLLSKVANETVARKLKRLLEASYAMKEALAGYASESDPTPGNIASGISTLAEKSLGSILKIGRSSSIKLLDVLPYASPVPRGRGGLFFMDTPGEDIPSISGMVAGGAHAVIFTTGLGTPVGSVTIPVVKVTANKDTYSRLSDIIDVYIPVEEIFDGKSLKSLAMDTLYPYLLEVLSGEKLTKSEINKQMDFDVRGFWMRV
ncbi:MAG: UxaA family hydrolase [Thermofilaceae archaeon]|nr:UxaA family hydrolase [Thermofilaceae archaeon]MCX8180205.1 UxaA family hydrolase [Thermofilaceae archaeon]MDW8004139.1 UxaA family hydrolase [Thermofilaceae archaeon]